MKNNCIVFKISDNIKNKLINFYEPYFGEAKPPYSVFQAKCYDVVITLYESGKVMFQGIGADIEVIPWIELEKKLNKRVIDISSKDQKDKKPEKKDEDFMIYSSTIGSDEAGCGDFFGPIVVCACYVPNNLIFKLKGMGIKDSKKITDNDIRKLAPKITQLLPYSCYILDNETYNKNSTSINMIKLKCILHNKVLCSLVEKNNIDYKYAVIDKFVNEEKYYEYLKGSQKILKNIKFYTKGESKCMAVAAASIIARYIFLLQIDAMSKELGFTVQKGAGIKVDEQINKIIKEKGTEALNKYGKLNFNNYRKLFTKIDSK